CLSPPNAEAGHEEADYSAGDAKNLPGFGPRSGGSRRGNKGGLGPRDGEHAASLLDRQRRRDAPQPGQGRLTRWLPRGPWAYEPWGDWWCSSGAAPQWGDRR